MTRRLVWMLTLLVGCSSPPPKRQPPPEPNPGWPVIFKIDRSNPPPMLEIQMTNAEYLRVTGKYASFLIEMGDPEQGTVKSFKRDAKGSLEIPWRFFLPLFKSPYVVRLVGVLSSGAHEVIFEETY